MSAISGTGGEILSKTGSIGISEVSAWAAEARIVVASADCDAIVSVGLEVGDISYDNVSDRGRGTAHSAYHGGLYVN